MNPHCMHAFLQMPPLTGTGLLRVASLLSPITYYIGQLVADSSSSPHSLQGGNIIRDAAAPPHNTTLY